MNPAEQVARALASHFGLDVRRLLRGPAFARAVEGALAVASVDLIVAEVVELGSLNGARNPYGVVVRRVHDVPGLIAEQARLDAEKAETRRWAAVDRAARRGETLCTLVDQERLFPDEAAEMLAREFADEDLRAIAQAALERGGS